MFTLRASSTALLVVDMQNDFVRRGAPLEVEGALATVPSHLRLLEWFRLHERPVIFTRVVSGPEPTLGWLWNPESGPPTCLVRPGFMRRYLDRDLPLDCSEVIDELPVHGADLTVVKYGYSAFHRTNLTSLLLNHGADTIVVTGTVTQVCVEDTVRGGYQEGFKVALVTDAVSSYDEELQRASIRNLGAHWCRLVTTDEVLAELGRAQGNAGAAALEQPVLAQPDGPAPQ